MKQLTIASAVLIATITQSACIMVGGYSRGDGWFLWPGSFGLILILVFLYLLFGRR